MSFNLKRFAINLYARHPQTTEAWFVFVYEVHAEDLSTAQALLRDTIMEMKENKFTDIFLYPQNEDGLEFEMVRCVHTCMAPSAEGYHMKGARQRRKENLE